MQFAQYKKASMKRMRVSLAEFVVKRDSKSNMQLTKAANYSQMLLLRGTLPSSATQGWFLPAARA